jgi:tetratricopeptide (TPR) repeat protein
MFEQLLSADVVVADVSTSNPNAFYELGVRHALRPHTTITIAEDKMIFPFDVQNIAIRKYHHLGEDIGFSEVMRMKGALKAAMVTILNNPANDSPVYTFFADLQPPARKIVAQTVAASAPLISGAAEIVPAQTISTLLKQADLAIGSSDFLTAKSLLKAVREIAPKDPFVAQRLAFATYKSKLPSLAAALEEARVILAGLAPEVSTDTETLGLWGAVHKRLWDLGGDRANLDKAIIAYEKGFCLKGDYWNGINVAYLFNLRASVSQGDDAIADRVLAARARKRVLAICDALLKTEDLGRPLSEKYWLLATMAEAWLGLRDKDQANSFLALAAALEPKPDLWMLETTEDQLTKLAALL